MIIYYITHPSCRGEEFLDIKVDISKLRDNLLQYFLTLNITNYCPSPLREKGEFLRVEVRVRVMDTIEHSF